MRQLVGTVAERIADVLDRVGYLNAGLKHDGFAAAGIATDGRFGTPGGYVTHDPVARARPTRVGISPQRAVALGVDPVLDLVPHDAMG